jgi:hypothetical protein
VAAILTRWRWACSRVARSKARGHRADLIIAFGLDTVG